MAGQQVHHHSMRGVGGRHQDVAGLPPAPRPHQMVHQYQGAGVIVSVGQQQMVPPNGHMAVPPSHQSGPPMQHVHQQPAPRQYQQHGHVLSVPADQHQQQGPTYHQQQPPSRHSQHAPPDQYRPMQHHHSVPPPNYPPQSSLPNHVPPPPQPVSYQQQNGGIPMGAPPIIGQILDPSSCSSNSSSLHLTSKEKTPMCLVNELARFNKVQHQYRLTDESGPAHKKTFTVCLKIGDKEEYIASGPSIKKAQHAASAIALEKTQFKHPTPKVKNVKNANVTPTVELNALAMKRGEPTTYSFLEPRSAPSANGNGSYNNGGGTCNGVGRGGYGQRNPGYPPMFCVQLRVGNRDFYGEGATAQAAKHGAAGKALKILRDMPVPDTNSKLDPTSLPFVPGSEYDELKSPISLAHEIALKRNLVVQFEVTRETGPPHMRTFITKCIVGNFVTEGEGNGKKVSKKRAAELMLEQLKQLPPIASAVVPRPRKVSNPGKKKAKNLIKVDAKEGPIPGGVVTGDQSINPISRLIQIQQARKEKEPQYILLSESGMPRRREFVMQVTVGSQSANGSGPSKKLAKRAAAEALLQLLGYSRPSLQPSKPAIKSQRDPSDKTKKLTFVDEVSSAAKGSSGRQLVPGLLFLDNDKSSKTVGYKQGPAVVSVSNLQPQVNGQSSAGGNTQVATIAAELLNGGTSPTADALAVSNLNTQHLTSLPSQGVQPKEQLAYLSQVLGFSVSYTDFPKKGEYLSLVSLSTNPPQVSHGAGSTLEGSHNNAAHNALRALANNGLDNVSNNLQQEEPGSSNGY